MADNGIARMVRLVQSGVIELEQAPHLLAVERMARELLDAHGLPDWGFRWDTARDRAGLECEADSGFRRIQLSARLMAHWPMDEIRQIVLHEIAHGLTPFHYHDATWRAMMRSLGARPDARWTPDPLVRPPVPYRWTGVCESGHQIRPRHKLTARARTRVCARCRARIRWEDNTQ